MRQTTPRFLNALVLAGFLACGGRTQPARQDPGAPPPPRPQTRPPEPRAEGTLSGRITDQATSLALAGATVFAQDALKPRLLAKAETGADGSFTLKGLPLGVPVRVVTQPVAGALAYAAALSRPVTLTREAPAPAVDLACAQAAQAGSVELAKAPRPVGVTEVALVQEKDTGEGGRLKIVVRTAMTDAAGACRFDGVPTGQYELHFLTAGGRPHPHPHPRHPRRPGRHWPRQHPPRRPGGRRHPVAAVTVAGPGITHVNWPARLLAADCGPDEVQDGPES